MSYIGISPYLYKNSVSTVDTFDDISGSFNGVTTTFNITVGGASYTRLTAKACLIVLGGIVQEAGVDYTVNAGQITFTTAPASGLTFEGRHLFGLNGVDTPTLGSVYPATLSTGGPSWDTSGNVTVSGNLTVNGSTTTINSTTLSIDDKNIVVADGVSTLANLDTAGIDFGSTAVRLRYNYNGGTNSGLSIEGTNVGIGTTVPAGILHCVGLKDSSNFIFSAPLTTVGGTPYQNYSELLFKNSLSNNTSDASIRHYANIWDSSGSQLRLLTSNTSGTLTTAITINAQQNVGIGTTNPSSRLHVVSGSIGAGISSFGTAIRINGEYGTPNSNHGIGFAINGNSPSAGIYVTESNGSGTHMRFATATSYTSPSQVVAMSIDSVGNVGIGTTNAPNLLTLGAAGGASPVVRLTDTTTGVFSILIGEATTGGLLFSADHGNGGADTAIKFSTDGNQERLRITASGNVGIGITNPGYKLQVNSSSVAFGTNGGSFLQRILNGGTGDYTIELDTTEYFRIKNTGNVGIGTTNPGTKLHITSGSDQRQNIARFDHTNQQSLYIQGQWGSTDIGGANGIVLFTSAETLAFRSGSSGTSHITLRSTGNVGIGTSEPTEKLHVYGEFRVRGTTATNRYTYISSVGQIFCNVANNDNVSNLVLDNVGDATSNDGHGSNILWRTSDNTPSAAIDSGKLSIVKSETWTSNVNSRNSRFDLALAKNGTLETRLRVNSYSGGPGVVLYKRSANNGTDSRTAEHQYLFVEPDGDGPAYYRRSLVSAYKGYNQYSYWAIRYDGASYDYTGSLKCRITWSTAHASGAGFAEFSLAVRSGDSDGGPAPAGNIIQYGAVQYSGGWYYGWTVNPDFDVYYAGFNENKQFLVLRLNGYMNHNGGTYDGGVHETVDLQSWGNAFQGIYRIGTSAPAGFTLNAITKTILS